MSFNTDAREENLKNYSNGLFRLAIAFLASAGTLLGGAIAVTPEPSMVALTAVGVGAIVLIARRKRGR
jgi:hypothetical protein